MDRTILRKAYCRLCEQMEPELMITLATNQSWDAAKMSSLIGRFFGRLDRRGLGHGFNEAAPTRRADGIFFIEKPGMNVHAHGLVTIPYDHDGSISPVAEQVWLELCPSGSINVQTISSVAGAALYCTKEVANLKYDPDQVVLVRGLMSQKSLTAPTN